MKNSKLNIHSFTVLVVVFSLTVFNWQYGNETFVFFGFAENKELEIRLEHPVSVENIYVTAGSRVKKGEVLLRVTRSEMALAQSGLGHNIAQLQSQLNMWESNLRSSIRSLEAEKTAAESKIRSEIAQLESEMAINQSLVKDLASISPAKDNSGNSPNELKVQGLRRELQLATQPLVAEIRKLTNELNTPENAVKIQIRKLEEELGFVYNEEEKLTIKAPTDGVVGSIFCKVGEQFSGYNTLLTFYEENPTQVKGYVLESLVLKVKMEDEITVQSSVQPSSKCRGKVVGMGSRIVEIPERLRKNPTFKTYGREILIEIPTENTFLQKEKVVLRLLSEKEAADKVIRAFTPPAVPVGDLMLGKVDVE